MKSGLSSCGGRGALGQWSVRGAVGTARSGRWAAAEPQQLPWAQCARNGEWCAGKCARRAREGGQLLGSSSCGWHDVGMVCGAMGTVRPLLRTVGSCWANAVGSVRSGWRAVRWGLAWCTRVGEHLLCSSSCGVDMDRRVPLVVRISLRFRPDYQQTPFSHKVVFFR